ncbi:MAG: NAD(P)H dehydrogenase (quinone), Type IV, partial [uncultured Acetobacteraceae bacterium]
AQGPCAVLLQLRPHRGHGLRHGRGCRRGGGRGGRDARPGNRAGRRRAGCRVQGRPAGADRLGGRPRKLRRDHRRRRHQVRADGVADERLPGPSRRDLGAGRSPREGRRGLHLFGDPAWRPGDHPAIHHRQPSAFRHDDRRPGLRLCRPDDAGPGERRVALRRHDGRRRRRIPPSFRQRLGRVAVPGPQDRRGGRQAVHPAARLSIQAPRGGPWTSDKRL